MSKHTKHVRQVAALLIGWQLGFGWAQNMNASDIVQDVGAHSDKPPGTLIASDSSADASRDKTAVAEAKNQGHRWAMSVGFNQIQAGNFSAKESTLSVRHFSELGSIAVERLEQNRNGYSDQAWAVDAYPKLWHGAYANLRYQQSNSPDLYPANAWRAELFQDVGHGWELAVSRDFLGFGPGVVINGISAGKYWGNFFVRWRRQQVESNSTSAQGDRLFVRYYYRGDADHYLEINAAQGRSDDFRTGMILPSRSDSRGLVWYHFLHRDWGIKLSASQSVDPAGLGAHVRDAGLSLIRRW